MKKTIFGCLAAAMVACTITSCKNTCCKMENDVDTLSYATGVMYADGLNSYVLQTYDSIYLEDVYKGIQEGMKAESDAEKAYYFGLQIGSQLKNQIVPMMNERLFADDSTKKINEKVLLCAFIKAAQGDTTLIYDASAAQIVVSNAQDKANEKKMEAQYGENKAAGIAWLENNKTAEGVQVTESGLQYKIISLGTGEKPSATDKVTVNYKGTLIDGTVFDSSYDRNEPTSFYLNSVIAGWTEGFQLMPEGSKFELYIPYELAYKAQDRGVIKPFSTLIFEIEFLKIEK